MEFKNVVSFSRPHMLRRCILLVLVTTSLFGIATCDIEQDKQRCMDKVIVLAPCLPYVTGEYNSKAPPMDCCTAFKQVLQESTECICLLIKDRNDPSLGLKINATLALSIPDKCNVHTSQRVTDCPTILHLPPNSPDAKIFQDFANSSGKSNSTHAAPARGNSTAAIADQKSDGGQSKRWPGIEIVAGLSIVAAHILNL